MRPRICTSAGRWSSSRCPTARLQRLSRFASYSSPASPCCRAFAAAFRTAHRRAQLAELGERGRVRHRNPCPSRDPARARWRGRAARLARRLLLAPPRSRPSALADGAARRPRGRPMGDRRQGAPQPRRRDQRRLGHEPDPRLRTAARSQRARRARGGASRRQRDRDPWTDLAHDRGSEGRSRPRASPAQARLDALALARRRRGSRSRRDPRGARHQPQRADRGDAENGGRARLARGSEGGQAGARRHRQRRRPRRICRWIAAPARAARGGARSPGDAGDGAGQPAGCERGVGTRKPRQFAFRRVAGRRGGSSRALPAHRRGGGGAQGKPPGGWGGDGPRSRRGRPAGDPRGAGEARLHAAAVQHHNHERARPAATPLRARCAAPPGSFPSSRSSPSTPSGSPSSATTARSSSGCLPTAAASPTSTWWSRPGPRSRRRRAARRGG